jgi:hypothetical protein
VPKTHVKGYRRRNGTYVRSYTQNRSGGNGSSGSRTDVNRRAVLAMGAAAAGVWLFRGQIFGPSSISGGTKLKIGTRSVRIGRVTLAFPQQVFDLEAPDSGRRSVRFPLDVFNGEATQALIVLQEQQLQSDAQENYYAIEGQVAVPPRGRRNLTLTFVIPDDEMPVTLTLRLGRRAVTVTLQEEPE